MDASKILSLKSNGEFFAARTQISVKDLENFYTVSPGNYRLYWSKTGFLDDAEIVSQFNGDKLAKEIFETVRWGDRKGLSVTLFWLPACKNFEIKLPWGYRKDNYKINGEALFFIPIDDENIKRILMLPLWELALSGGLKVEYLSNYFIDTAGVQNGLSLWIRDQILPQIIDIIDSNWESMRRKSNDEVTRCLRSRKLFLLNSDDLCKEIYCKEVIDGDREALS